MSYSIITFKYKKAISYFKKAQNQLIKAQPYKYTQKLIKNSNYDKWP